MTALDGLYYQDRNDEPFIPPIIPLFIVVMVLFMFIYALTWRY